MAFSPKGDLVAAASEDGILHIWDVKTGLRSALFIRKDRQWIGVTNDGYYDRSLNSSAMLAWRIRGEAFPFDQFEEVFQRPDILRRFLAGEYVKATPLSERSIPPDISFASPKYGTELSAAVVDVEISAKSANPIRNIVVMANGLPTPIDAPGDQSPQDGKEKQVTVRASIPLPPGEPRVRIRAVAYDTEGLKSQPDEVTIFRPGVKESVGFLHILSVGINQYKNPAVPSLKYAVPDARTFAETLEKTSRQYTKVMSKVITDADATLSNLKFALRDLKDTATENDVAVVFISGHGLMDKSGNFYFGTCDLALHDLPMTALDWKDFISALREIRAKRVLVLADTCHSGGIAGEQSGGNDALAYQLNKEAHRLVFVSSSRNEVSIGREEWRHGAFTKALVEALGGSADASNKDGRITYRELSDYVSKRVPELTDDRQHPQLPFPDNHEPDAVLVAGGAPTSPPPAPSASVAPSIVPSLMPTPVLICSSSSIGTTKVNPKDGAEMVRVPAGEFLMGSNAGRDDEKPQRAVYLDGYWMYKYEVTVAQYRKFRETTKSKMPKAPPWGWKDDHPMVKVTWQDAADYAKWAGARLPTEAEWEKAARGTDGRKYPWGYKWDASKCANRVENMPEGTRPVGSYPAGASPCGAMDMAGNIMEWCADWHGQDYKHAPTRNPPGPSSGVARVLRDCSWSYNNDEYSRCAYRNYGDAPAHRSDLIGFRCALSSVDLLSSDARIEPPSPPPAHAVSVSPSIVPSPVPTPVPEPSSPSEGDTKVNPEDGAEMVWVPAGEFTVGSTDEKTAATLKELPESIQDLSRFYLDAEKPQRKVHLDSYWIYKYEVTVAQYRKFCQTSGRGMPDAPSFGWEENDPMVLVTWQDAADYAKWAGVSLPTEAQWEKAARGMDGRTYPWGDSWDKNKCANYGLNLISTAEVGGYPAGVSPYGALDMAGNALEWCADWYDPDYYKTAPARNPRGPS